LAAVEKGDAKKLAGLMRQDPGFNVNMWQNGVGWTLLHLACDRDQNSPVIPLLLAHPDIDVNSKDRLGVTPFDYASAFACTSCVREMLKDSRVKVNEPNGDGQTPIWSAASYGYLDIVKWWIATGREMDLGKPGDVDNTDAIGGAKKNGWTEVASLLERFKENPEETRHMVRVELGWYDDLAAEMFALVVFVSDGLLQVTQGNQPTLTLAARFLSIAFRKLSRKSHNPNPKPPDFGSLRFFRIATRLPLDLQMVLCHRVVGSGKEIIPGKDSEVAFKELAKTLLWSSIFTN